MGLDLTLVPHYWGDRPMNDGIFPHVKLSLPGGARDMDDRMVEAGVQAYVLAGELATVKHGRTSWEPAWAYLRALPPRTPVVLWWH